MSLVTSQCSDIDDITKLSLSDGTKLILYADDLLFYRPISSPQDPHLLQHDIDIVQAYATAQYVTYNRSKCKYINTAKSICYFDNCICHQNCNCWL